MIGHYEGGRESNRSAVGHGAGRTIGSSEARRDEVRKSGSIGGGCGFRGSERAAEGRVIWRDEGGRRSGRVIVVHGAGCDEGGRGSICDIELMVVDRFPSMMACLMTWFVACSMLWEMSQSMALLIVRSLVRAIDDTVDDTVDGRVGGTVIGAVDDKVGDVVDGDVDGGVVVTVDDAVVGAVDSAVDGAVSGAIDGGADVGTVDGAVGGVVDSVVDTMSHSADALICC